MFVKLLKYEFKMLSKSLGKILLIISACVLGANLLMYLFKETSLSEVSEMSYLFGNILGMAIVLAIDALIVIIPPSLCSIRYNNNVAADNAYLMNTLPTKPSHRILSSLTSQIIWWMLCILVGLFLGSISPETDMLNVRIALYFLKDTAVNDKAMFAIILLDVLVLITAMLMANIMANTLSMRFFGRRKTADIVSVALYLVYASVFFGSWLLCIYLNISIFKTLVLELAILTLITLISYISSRRILENHINIA